MQKAVIKKTEIKLVGISVRTSYHKELDKTKGNISHCVQKYFHENLSEKISNRKSPGTTYCIYTQYESDYKGAYTYFIGEEVTSFDDPLEEGFQGLTVPQQQYVKFTTNPAPMPDVVANAWKEIWKMPPNELGGKRCYNTDFEIYDERAADHQKTILDIYVGIES